VLEQLYEKFNPTLSWLNLLHRVTPLVEIILSDSSIPGFDRDLTG